MGFGQMGAGPDAAAGDEDAETRGKFQQPGENLVAGQVREPKVEHDEIEALWVLLAEAKDGLARVASSDFIPALCEELAE